MREVMWARTDAREAGSTVDSARSMDLRQMRNASSMHDMVQWWDETGRGAREEAREREREVEMYCFSRLEYAGESSRRAGSGGGGGCARD